MTPTLIHYLKALVATAKGAENLYEQQAAAMEFTTAFGEELITLASAGEALYHLATHTPDVDPYTNRFKKYAIEKYEAAWDVATKEDV